MTNAFTIPKESSVTKDKRAFPKTQVKTRNMQPIVLPGSSKHLPPKMLERKK